MSSIEQQDLEVAPEPEPQPEPIWSPSARVTMSSDEGGASPAGPPVNQAPTAFSLGGGGGAAAPAARAPAAAGGATVVQAMKFMQDPSVTDMTVKIASQTHDWRHP